MSFKEARKKNNLTQKELAQKLGTTRVTVARWECGINNPIAFSRIMNNSHNVCTNLAHLAVLFFS